MEGLSMFLGGFGLIVGSLGLFIFLNLLRSLFTIYFSPEKTDKYDGSTHFKVYAIYLLSSIMALLMIIVSVLLLPYSINLINLF